MAYGNSQALTNPLEPLADSARHCRPKETHHEEHQAGAADSEVRLPLPFASPSQERLTQPQGGRGGDRGGRGGGRGGFSARGGSDRGGRGGGRGAPRGGDRKAGRAPSEHCWVPAPSNALRRPADDFSLHVLPRRRNQFFFFFPFFVWVYSPQTRPRPSLSSLSTLSDRTNSTL